MQNERERPDPDRLLAEAAREDEARRRGKLKVFLGYAAGVGKTYAMLEAAQRLRDTGVDVVAGYIETHGRRETDELLVGLELIPRRRVDYRGTILTELDVDAVLRRKPAIVLVDELAHTNAPGLRHPKRYEDVEELLAAGIDVHTTLNIQHLESLNDTVAQITNVKVRETVPDRILDEADDIELIDLPLSELLQRLTEGKVYVPDQAGRAMRQFFRRGNLGALRQMALRRVAERVDTQMRDYMHERDIEGPWPAGERLIVCVSPSPLSERLVRTAKRWADRLNAEWDALYVEGPSRGRLSELAKQQLARNLQLAEELGANVATVTGQQVADAVTDYARRNNATKIIVGRPLRPRWAELFRSSVVDEIIRRSGPIDVNVITADAGALHDNSPRRTDAHELYRYAMALLLVVAANWISGLLFRRIDPANLVMVYLAAVLAAATFLGTGQSVLVSVLGVVTFDYFWVEPRISFAVKDTQYFLTFFGLLVVGLVVSTMAAQARAQLDAARDRERQTAALVSLSRELTSAVGLDQIITIVTAHVSDLTEIVTAIFLPDDDGRLRPGRPGYIALDDNEAAVAAWAFGHRDSAGCGTDTLAAARGRYVPLITPHGSVGVIGLIDVHSRRQGCRLLPGERQLLEAIANLAAVAIERAQLVSEASRFRLHKAKEEFQSTLLNSVSHDLRTPLVSVMGVLSTLRAEASNRVVLDADSRRTLIETACEQAERLNRLFANLLDMTRLEAQAVSLKREPSDLQDAIGAALSQLGERVATREIRTEIPADLPLIAFDFVLIVQVLVNLVDNALKYSPADAPIDVAVHLARDAAEVSVADRGMGIPDADLELVFTKFYRVARPDAGGTGLGLTICRGIVEAHGGRIWAQHRPGGGTTITFRLPLAEGADGESQDGGNEGGRRTARLGGR